MGMRVNFYESKEKNVPKDMFIIIKEPLFSQNGVNRDKIPTILVTNPKDLIFNADQMFKISLPKESD